MTRSKSNASGERDQTLDEGVDNARMGPSIRALGATLIQVVDARLGLLEAEWRLSLSALALSFVALVTLGALLAMSWFAVLVLSAYGITLWLGHWLWGVCFFLLLQTIAIWLFWRLSRSFIGMIGFKHSLAIKEPEDVDGITEK